MSQSTKTTQSEILNTQSNTEKTHKSTSLITNEEVPNTPFRLVGSEEKGYALTIREYMLTEFKPTKLEALQNMENNMWILTANLIGAILEIEKSLEPNRKYTKIPLS